MRAVSLASSMDGPTKTILVSLLLLLAAGGILHSQFLSPAYLLQQLHSGAFLGIVAVGAMIVILLGHIDLSVPWTITASATFATALVGTTPHAVVSEVGLIAGLCVGMVIGFVNGFGVAYLRIPSMIWTLATNNIVLGICVLQSGFYATRSQPSHLMSTLGADRIFGMPLAVIVWFIVSMAMVFLLIRTRIGRYIYAVGTREEAAYLSGIDTRKIIVFAFVVAGLCSAVAGLLLAGYAGQSYQRMGDPYLLPGIAAVVLGGSSLFGGRGSYAGTVAGVLLITLISSMLSIMQAPEAAKQICYGAVILLMVGLYGRRQNA
jgi:ribose transport system permease protein